MNLIFTRKTEKNQKQMSFCLKYLGTDVEVVQKIYDRGVCIICYTDDNKESPSLGSC